MENPLFFSSSHEKIAMVFKADFYKEDDEDVVDASC